MLKFKFPRGAEGFVTGFIARSMSHASTLILMLYAARHIAPELFGAYAIASLVVAFTTMLLYSGVYEYLLRTEDISSHSDTAFSILLFTGIILTGAQLFFADALSHAFRSEALKELVRLLAVVPLIGSLSAWREAIFLRDSKNLARYYTILIFRDISSLAIGVTLLWCGAGLYALISSRLYTSLCGLIILTFYVPKSPRIRWIPSQLKAIFSYGIGIASSRGLGFVAGYGVDLTVGLMLNPAAVGIYRMSSRIVVAASDIVTQPMSKLAWVELSEDARINQNALQIWQRLQRFTLLIAWPALAFIIIAAPELVLLVLGEQWLAAAPITSFLSAAAMIQVATVLLEPLLTVKGQGTHLFSIRLFSTISTIGLAFLFSSQGVEAVAVSQIAAAVLTFLTTVLIAKRAVRVSSMAVWTSSRLPIVILASILLIGYCLRLVDKRFLELSSHSMLLLNGLLVIAVATFAWLLIQRLNPDASSESK